MDLNTRQAVFDMLINKKFIRKEKNFDLFSLHFTPKSHIPPVIINAKVQSKNDRTSLPKIAQKPFAVTFQNR